MQQKKTGGSVQTVVGPVPGDSLGKTLMHEHIFFNSLKTFVEPYDAAEKALAHEALRLDNIYWIKLHPFSNLANRSLSDEQQAIKEVNLFKTAGGTTITEVTPNGGLGRNPLGLARVARETGVNIIMGTGYHVGALHPEELSSRTEQDITDEMVKELTVGIDDTGICAGIIGEIGCSMPFEEKERKMLRCCAAAQQQTGAAIYVHPSPSDELVLENVQELKDAGADLSRVVIGHIDAIGFKDDTYRRIADMGCYIGVDSFGNEGFSDVPHKGFYVELSDVKRVDTILSLIKDGYLNHIIISHDIGSKIRLTSYGGTGYAHILRDVVPIMRIKGLSEKQIDVLLVENPSRALSLPPEKNQHPG